jgi:hypothetical protein
VLYHQVRRKAHLSLLVNPVELSRLPLVNLLLLEPKSNLLLCVLNAIATVADIAADINGKVTTDGTWQAVLRVGSTEDGAAGLDGITTFPDHGADGAGGHVCGILLKSGLGWRGKVCCKDEGRTGNETGEEWLLAQVLIMFLEVLLGGSDKLNADEFEAVVF